MAVVVPKVEGQNLKLSAEDRGLGMMVAHLTSMRLQMLTPFGGKGCHAAEMEATLKRLLEEIEATKKGECP